VEKEEEIPPHLCARVEKVFEFLESVTDKDIRETGSKFSPPEKHEAVVNKCSKRLRQHLTAVVIILGRAVNKDSGDDGPVFASRDDVLPYNALASISNALCENEIFGARQLRRDWVIIEPIIVTTLQ